MRVLVTGSTGFIGSHLMEELNKIGINTTVLVRKNNSDLSWLNKSTIFYGDITNSKSVYEAIKGVDVVFNLASLLGRWQSEFSYSQYCKVNLKGTKNLLFACQKEGIRHFIHLSTAGVMGRLTKIPADETHPLLPMFPYEKSKHLAEVAINNLILKENFPATILRATHVYGPRDKNTAKIFKMLEKFGVFPLIGGGNNLFQPLYVSDVVTALILCMEKREHCLKNTYLLSGKEILTYHDFIHLSAIALGVPVFTMPLSENLAKIFSSLIESTFTSFNKEPPLTRSRVEFFSRNQTYKICKINDAVGFFPEMDIITGLKKMVTWYRTFLHLKQSF